jgi:hypothetical protein
MVALLRRAPAALTLASGLAAIVAVAQPSPAAAHDSEATQSMAIEPCVTGYRFEPGPIVDGHNRQPTPREFEARLRELRTLTQGSAGSCAALLRSSPSGDVARDELSTTNR